ncbi:unnamed protein product [Linum trigynum]|uniref:Uncharacterized protein n=1 Tax=Linum trigynum TaxID=586398 RepID=A0AAV2GLZ8_9ROSI
MATPFGPLDARLDRIESTQELILHHLGDPYVPFHYSSGASTSGGGPSAPGQQEDDDYQTGGGDYPGSD